MARKIGILTGGGDAPGLNAVINGIVVNGTRLGYEVWGMIDGWAGVLNGNAKKLTLDDVEDIHRQGGTIIGTSRTPIFAKKEGQKDRSDEAVAQLKKLDLYALIAIGGEDTLGEANRLFKDGRFPNIVGVPKTIDNDLNATDYTFGFNTSVNIAMEALDRLHTTTKSHHRVMIVEIMGRHAGWITLEAGLAGGAHMVLIPEVKFNFEDICEFVKNRYETGKDYTIIAVAEGCEEADSSKEKATDNFGHVMLGGIGEEIEKRLQEWLTKNMKKPYPEFKFEARSMVLGHLQRGGAPTAYDRVLGARLGINAVKLVDEGKFGHMVSLRGTDIIPVTLQEAVGTLKTVPTERYEEELIFLGLKK
ncbi:TPA: ATP-dependent 6-phosphofructokinase [bacterium]|jgi:6-phosphofructokinase 1|nr:ATP-dependent 6-phosphofructokinase [bacterium]